MSFFSFFACHPGGRSGRRTVPLPNNVNAYLDTIAPPWWSCWVEGVSWHSTEHCGPAMHSDWRTDGTVAYFCSISGTGSCWRKFLIKLINKTLSSLTLWRQWLLWKLHISAPSHTTSTKFGMPKNPVLKYKGMHIKFIANQLESLIIPN